MHVTRFQAETTAAHCEGNIKASIHFSPRVCHTLGVLVHRNSPDRITFGRRAMLLKWDERIRAGRRRMQCAPATLEVCISVPLAGLCHALLNTQIAATSRLFAIHVLQSSCILVAPGLRHALLKAQIPATSRLSAIQIFNRHAFL